MKIILSSHGELAQGILQSAEMIFGDQEDIEAVILKPSEGPEDLYGKLTAALPDGDTQVLFLVDLWGGSPFNQANIIYEENAERSAIVAGLNLPMLLEALGGRMMGQSVQEIATKIVETAREGVRVKPEELEPVEATSEEEAEKAAPASSASLPEGTVLGDGKIEYPLVRIDTRLLHGQVSTGWVPAIAPTRIIVVSDSVSEDDMRKTLIKQAAPSGYRANVIPVAKLAEIDKDPRFGKTKALLLFEKPEDVLEAMDLGIEFTEVNLGSMAHSAGKDMISRALSVDANDVKLLREMESRGVTFDVRRVPADPPEDLDQLLKSAGY